MATKTRESLKLMDYSDLELIALIDDLLAEDGWATTEAVARGVGFANGSRLVHGKKCVGVRLGWLRRFGAVEKMEGEQKWRPSEAGDALVRGKLGANTAKALATVKDDQLLVLMRGVGERWQRAGDTPQTLARREWRYSTGGRG